MKVCVLSSCGGHLTEMLALRAAYASHEHFFVLNERVMLPEEMAGKTMFVSHSERDWRFLLNLWEAWRILTNQRPDVILTTGAGLAVPFALIAKLRRVPVVFVEISAFVEEPSLTGRIMHRLADRLFYQWEGLGRHFPRGTFGGSLL